MSSLLPLLVAATVSGTPDALSPFEAEIAAAVASVKDVYPVPAALVRAVIKQESGFRPNAVSPVGARGLMQIMPFNAEKLGFKRANLVEPASNIMAGTRYLAVLLRHYHGDIISALVAYNCRANTLGAPIPKNSETPEYVRRVLANYAAYLKLEGKPLETRARALPPPPPTKRTENSGPLRFSTGT